MMSAEQRQIEPVTYTVGDICRIAGISRATVYRLIDRGALRRTKIGTRTLIFADSLHRLLEEGRDNVR